MLTRFDQCLARTVVQQSETIVFNTKLRQLFHPHIVNHPHILSGLIRGRENDAGFIPFTSCLFQNIGIHLAFINRIVQKFLRRINQQILNTKQTRAHQNFQPLGFSCVFIHTRKRHSSACHIALFGALSRQIRITKFYGLRIVVIEHRHEIECRQIARIDNFKNTDGAALEQNRQHFIFPPAISLCQWKFLIALSPHVGCRRNIPLFVNIISQNAIGKPISHNIKGKPSGFLYFIFFAKHIWICISFMIVCQLFDIVNGTFRGLVNNQRAHPCTTVNIARLPIRHNSPGHGHAGQREIDIAIKPQYLSSQTVAAILQFEFGHPEKLGIFTRFHHGSYRRLDLARQIVHIDMLNAIDGRIDKTPHC